MIRNIVLAAFTFILFAVGCRQKSEELILARVGDAVLTLNEAKAHIDTTQLPYDDKINAYIVRWVEDEILFQEAVRKGIQKTESFRQSIRDIERKMAIQNLLDNEVYKDTSQIDENALLQYYLNHKSEFFVREDIVKLNFITFTNWRNANRFTSSLKSGKPWIDAIDEIRKDTGTANSIIDAGYNRYYSQNTLYPIELWRVASALVPDEVSFPVKTGDKYTVLQVLERIKSGSEANFELAQDEVRMRLIINEKRKKYNDLLNKLRNNSRIEILYGSKREIDSAYTPVP